MAVYVDDMKAKFGRMVMCHMIADTTEELLVMADKIGVARKWIQKSGTWKEHFDVSLGAKAKAIEAGALQITMSEVGRMLMVRLRAEHAARTVKTILSMGLLLILLTSGCATIPPTTHLEYNDYGDIIEVAP